MKSNLLCCALVIALATFSHAAPIDEPSGMVSNNQGSMPDLPSDVLRRLIFPRVPFTDAVSLRKTDKQFKNIVESLLKDFSPVVKACGNETANKLIKQQWSPHDQQMTSLAAYDKHESKQVHECLWATKKWVETLDEPQIIRLSITLQNANETAGFLLDEKLFDNSGKARFKLSLAVDASQGRGLLEKVYQAVSTNKCIKSLDFEEND
jgi:hypothetical protein